jgi:hypothetical protein
VVNEEDQKDPVNPQEHGNRNQSGRQKENEEEIDNPGADTDDSDNTVRKMPNMNS